MRCQKLFFWVLLSFFVFISVSMVGLADEYREVQASEILTKIENGEDVNLTDCRIIGELNSSEIKLQTIPNPKYYELFKSGYSEEDLESYRINRDLKVVESNITICDSTFEDDLDFSSLLFKKPVCFCRVNYSSAVYFISSNFSNSTHFTESTFGNSVSFMGSTFGDFASFSETNFGDFANFFETIFGDSADFSFSSFGNSTDFSLSTFGDSADFFGSTFGDSTSFLHSTFGNSAIFRQSIFGDSVYFSETNFGDSADFFETNFGDSADFSSSTFGYIAYFFGSTFGDSADFSESAFGDSASFPYSTFGDYASFSDATFGDSASFSESTFGDHTFFSETNFGDSASFSETNFGDFANFVEAFFVDSSSFEGAYFAGTVDFSGTLFQEVSLHGTDFNEIRVSWDSFENSLVFDGPIYVKLIQNFRNLEQFEDADAVYFQYRKHCQAEKSWIPFSKEGSKWWDIVMCFTCGYGVKPFRAFYSAILIIFLFSSIYRGFPTISWRNKGDLDIAQKSPIKTLLSLIPEIDWPNSGISRLSDNKDSAQKVTFWDSFYFSMGTFSTIGYGDWYPKDNFRKFVMFEGFLGWITLGLFLVTLTNVTMRP